MRKLLIEIKNFKIKNLVFLIFIIFLISGNLKAFENRILFKIDNELITSIDIYNKSKYLIAMNEDIKNLEEAQIFELSKSMIIKEKIKKEKNEEKKKKEEARRNPIIFRLKR